MYDIAICDDDAVFAGDFQAQLSRVLDEAGADHRITVFSEPDALLRAVDSGCRYVLLFLDVMFARTERGISLASSLRQRGCEADIVFMSVLPDFAAASFDVSPLHYLIKPIQEEKLRTALSRFLERNTPCLLRFNTDGGYLQLPLAEVTFFEIFTRQIVIHKTNGEKEVCVGRLKELEDRLPADTFVRPHRSYLVNLDHISEITRYQLRVSTGDTVPVSQKLYAQVQKIIINHADRRTLQF